MTSKGWEIQVNWRDQIRDLSMELPYLCQTIKWLLINTPIRQTQF